MKKIAILLEHDFEDSEYGQPAVALAEAGHELVHLGIEKNTEVTGKKHGTRVKIEQAVKDVSPDDFDALLIPGGYSPDKLRVHQPAVDFVRDCVTSGKPTYSICHGPQLLITADVLRGRTITGYQSIRQDIINAGATFEDAPVVTDKNIVSSRNPDDLPYFISTITDHLSNQ